MLVETSGVDCGAVKFPHLYMLIGLTSCTLKTKNWFFPWRKDMNNLAFYWINQKQWTFTAYDTSLHWQSDNATLMHLGVPFILINNTLLITNI